MPNLITNLTATTELEAVNAMLAAIAEAPITDLSAGQALTDVAMATNELRKATREVQTLPWKFNTRFQVPISPAGTVVWTDPDGTINTLNVFTPPANLSSFEASPTAAQTKSGRPLDLTLGPSVVYTPGTQVFVDRTYNRDGLIATDYPKLYIDATYFFDFMQLPESARAYITVLAGRRFIQSVVGAQELVGFTQQDTGITLRTIKRDQGIEDSYNLLDNPDVRMSLGMRPRMGGPFVDTRRSR
jgi:hypothetical protein